jgi:hypothetical protein
MRNSGMGFAESRNQRDGQFLNVASAASYESRVANKQVLEVSRLVAQDSKLAARGSRLAAKFEKVRT